MKYKKAKKIIKDYFKGLGSKASFPLFYDFRSENREFIKREAERIMDYRKLYCFACLNKFPVSLLRKVTDFNSKGHCIFLCPKCYDKFRNLIK